MNTNDRVKEIIQWHAEQEEAKARAEADVIQARRKELSIEFGFEHAYLNQTSPLSKAITRIIELERKAA